MERKEDPQWPRCEVHYPRPITHYWQGVPAVCQCPKIPLAGEALEALKADWHYLHKKARAFKKAVKERASIINADYYASLRTPKPTVTSLSKDLGDLRARLTTAENHIKQLEDAN